MKKNNSSRKPGREANESLCIPAVLKLKKLCGGTQEKMSKIMGTSQYSAFHWLRHGIPIKHRKKIEELFGDKISKEELWPDIFY